MSDLERLYWEVNPKPIEPTGSIAGDLKQIDLNACMWSDARRCISCVPDKGYSAALNAFNAVSTPAMKMYVNNIVRIHNDSRDAIECLMVAYRDSRKIASPVDYRALGTYEEQSNAILALEPEDLIYYVSRLDHKGLVWSEEDDRLVCSEQDLLTDDLLADWDNRADDGHTWALASAYRTKAAIEVQWYDLMVQLIKLEAPTLTLGARKISKHATRRALMDI